MTAEPTTPPPAEPEPPASPPFSTPEMVRIQADIAATRAELAATVDELATRLRPANQAKRAAANSRRLLADAVNPGTDPAARRRALIVLGAAAGVTALLTIGIIRKIVR